jgi:hypothetical protein
MDLAALMIAPVVRFRLAVWVASWVATRATTPNFRALESLVTLSILTASGATMTQRESDEPLRCDRHLRAYRKCGGNRGDQWTSSLNN